MRWLICGTFPVLQSSPATPQLIEGTASVSLQAGAALRAGNEAIPTSSLVHISGPAGDYALPIERGTPALIAAFCLVAAELGIEPPLVLLGADNGKGEGSRLVYERLTKQAASYAPSTAGGSSDWGITFHYLLPDVDWHNKILLTLEALHNTPLLCADAGYMYAAKMSGYASSYDLFTPDTGELAFLADPVAPHPFYTRGFLLSEGQNIEEQIQAAYTAGNAAKTMLVKGELDIIAEQAEEANGNATGKITKRIDYPMIPGLEPIGGTGDSVTGSVSALLSAGYPMRRACTLAAQANRFMGQLAQPTPATGIAELLAQLPGALRLSLNDL